MKVSSWTLTAEDMAAFATESSHMTISFLRDRGFLTEEEYISLTSSVIITAIEKNKSFGSRIIERFFKKESNEGSYAFVVAELPKIMDRDNEG